ncbi:hypothetical protein, partial [Lysinibacillus sp. FJAT-14222]|uniref:hypothetical protein n=1 Tax=Lysinibacillus sp. FJAT-14222 TaxID=1932366 RepID=UPI0006AF3039
KERPTDRNPKEKDRISGDGKQARTPEKNLRATERTTATTDKNPKETDRISIDGKQGQNAGKESPSDGKNDGNDG